MVAVVRRVGQRFLERLDFVLENGPLEPRKRDLHVAGLGRSAWQVFLCAPPTLRVSPRTNMPHARAVSAPMGDYMILYFPARMRIFWERENVCRVNPAVEHLGQRLRSFHRRTPLPRIFWNGEINKRISSARRRRLFGHPAGPGSLGNAEITRGGGGRNS